MPQVVKTDPRDAVLGPAQQTPEFLRQAERSSRLAVDTSVCRIPSCRSSSACLRLGRRSASTAKTGSVMVRCLLFLGGLKRSAPLASFSLWTTFEIAMAVGVVLNRKKMAKHCNVEVADVYLSWQRRIEQIASSHSALQALHVSAGSFDARLDPHQAAAAVG